MTVSPLLVVHITGGITGLLSGAVALTFRKGSRGHIVAGKVFVAAMLSMAGAGSYMAIIKSQTGNLLGGVMTLYLVATGWVAARRKQGETGIFDWGALAVVLMAGTVITVYGVQAVSSPAGVKDGYPPMVYIIWALLALLSATGDIRMLARRGVFSGSQKIVRHLWRICFGLFIATGSFFLGQQKVFPASLRGLKVWFVPAFLPLILLIYWVIRIRLKKEYREATPSYRTRNGGAKLQEQPLEHFGGATL